jgi:hypothetical protein
MSLGRLETPRHSPTNLHVNQDGSNQWRTSPDKDHAYLARKMDPKKIAVVIEKLMLRKPGLQK